MSVLYEDDDTDNVSDGNPEILHDKIPREAYLSTNWVKDDKLVCSGPKTKLLVVGTRKLRNCKLESPNRVLETLVDGCNVEESRRDRLLGIIMNNDLTWEHHLYGEKENRGLLAKLAYRASLISKLSLVLPRNRLKTMAEGLFFQF